jgi:predicted PurR-regulated permease PerM
MALLWACLFGALWVVRDVLLPFGIATLLAYVLHPAVSWLSARRVGTRHLPRWVSTLLLYAVMGLGMYAVVVLFIPQLVGELQGAARTGTAALSTADDYARTLPGKATAFLKKQGIPIVLHWSDAHGVPQGQDANPSESGDQEPWLEIDVRKELEGMASEWQSMARAALGQVARGAQGFVGALVAFVFKLFLVLMLTAFLLADIARMRRFALQMVPTERQTSFELLLERIDQGLSGVVRGQLTICLINGILTLVGLLLLNVKFAFLMATVAACLSLIPIFGSIVSSVPIVAVGLLDSFHKGFLALLWIVGIHALEANFLNPKIMGDAAKIHPVVVVLALVAGEHFFGFTGALFAVPVTSIGLTIFKFVLARALRAQTEVGSDPPPLAGPSTPAAPGG